MPERFLKKPTSIFQKRIYKIVSEIPKGRVMTYKAVAKLAGKSRAWRAVGNLLNKNKNPKIPCHRVVRSDGKISGFKEGTNRKIEILKTEGIKIRRRKLVK